MVGHDDIWSLIARQLEVCPDVKARSTWAVAAALWNLGSRLEDVNRTLQSMDETLAHTLGKE